ncbi:aminotransferase class I/II-fold pyridoxal phosphate-dependent enzyme [Anaerococcus sp.]|uniref:aminotransferase class I/II-fold pyridoxal phosphate-dependent enzyme n=1 Tax=Anaerococcus sp. TaxID=1872515 RepID=UPI002A75A3D1|nr:aminotransferase class I/II-fold pyridoxal phosphate-dependent enzyme [Anaerococcus sp.]MDY2927341.1 aminotransferase class I/II-fold pyridoxal phosphate-dependent enzyme [Anaerococcus sp.]
MLNENLDLYLNEGYYPFHMPGSKRSKILRSDLPYRRDLTEIYGFDNLNDPEDIFIQMEERLAQIYRVNKAIISTNGSTSGILSTIRAFTRDRKNILIQRSSHKSVYNACELNSLNVSYINIVTDEQLAIKDIDHEDLEEKLKEKNYQALVLTSPSYEGYLLNLKRIYKLCRENNTKLILDMAHGSHLPLTSLYDNSFDVAITSFHKNLSALTPSAAVLINDMEYFDEIKRNMAIFQTSSPSYVILQSIDEMIEKFKSFGPLYTNLENNLDDLYKLRLDYLKIIDDPEKDRSKILISTKNSNISGSDLDKLLREDKIEIEMSYPNYVLLISTIFDIKDGFNRLKNSLRRIDGLLEDKNKSYSLELPIPQKKLEIYEAIDYKKKLVKLEDSLGKIAGEFVYAYPPGSPILAPGELIDEKILSTFTYMLENNIHLNIKDEYIAVLIDK